SVAAVPMAGGPPRILVEGGTCPRFVRGGAIVYARAGTLAAGALDARGLRITGNAVPVLEDVRMVSKGSGGAHFALSASGSLAYVPRYPRPPPRSPVWIAPHANR